MKRSWLRPGVRDLELYYIPHVQGDPLRMDTNTNPLGENPVCQEGLRECREMDLEQYPSTYGDGLREALGRFYSLDRDHFVVGNGSDEILDIICKCFISPAHDLVMAYPAYSLHGWFSRINGGGVREVDLGQDFQLDVEGMLRAPGDLVIVCTPNNPTSNTFRRQDLLELVERSERPVVVDEAYGEFAGESFIPLVDRYPNLIVTRTFSKAYALAGIRVGYSVADPEMTLAMQKVRIPYSLDQVSEHIAIKALGNQEFVRRTVQVVGQEREHLRQGLVAMGFQVFPSEANFMLFKCPVPSAELVRRLERKGVLIRDFGRKRMLEDCARTTIGTREQNDVLLAKLGEVMREWR